MGSRTSIKEAKDMVPLNNHPYRRIKSSFLDTSRPSWDIVFTRTPSGHRIKLSDYPDRLLVSCPRSSLE